MIQIILVLALGISIGLLWKKGTPKQVSTAISITIYLLLFILGIEVGSNPQIFHSIHTIGLKALIIAIATTMGSIFFAWLLWKHINSINQQHEK